MEEPKIIKDFNNINSESLINPDFGIKNFSEIKPKFEEIYRLIKEMAQLAFYEEEFPEGIKTQIINIVTEFDSYYKQIKSYNIENDGAQQFRTHGQIITNFNNWHDSIIKGFDSQNKPKNFLTIYNATKNIANESISKNHEILKSYVGDAKTAKEDIDGILNELRKKSAEETVVDYANIFKSQAESYSSIQLKLVPWKDRNFKIGSSQVWLVVGIILGTALIFAIKYINDIFPFESTEVIEVRIIQLLTRFAFLSFLIYLVSFCFRQFSISKHLYTINKHRQNTLDSYKLFLASLDKADGTTRNALMMEVAKSIYEAGSTGYISGKQQDVSPSIIEMTRLIKDDK